MLESKGVSVNTVNMFVKTKFNSRFDEWISSLPPKSRNIHSKRIIPGLWYPSYDAIVAPTEKVIDMFYNGDKIASWEMGQFNASVTLTRIYSLFIKIATPEFLIKRTAAIMHTFYRPAKAEALKNKKGAILRITEFGEPNYLLELGIGGFIERALEICGCKFVKIEIKKSLAKGDNCTEYMGTWE